MADAPLIVSRFDSPLGALIAAGDDEGVRFLEFATKGALAGKGVREARGPRTGRGREADGPMGTGRCEQHLEALCRTLGRDPRRGVHPHLEALRAQLLEYFAGRRRGFDLPLRFSGTPFQERVWSALLTIPCGETRAYIDIARALGDPKAVRAVGAANGCNPISIVVPCHRVIGSDGSIVGYGGGLERKRWLLAHERGERRLF